MGLARITATSLSFWLVATTCQPSYPLNSENASPPGTFKVYLSCWARPMLAKPTHKPVTIAIAETLLLFVIVALLIWPPKWRSLENRNRAQLSHSHLLGT